MGHFVQAVSKFRHFILLKLLYALLKFCDFRRFKINFLFRLFELLVCVELFVLKFDDFVLSQLDHIETLFLLCSAQLKLVPQHTHLVFVEDLLIG